VASCSPLLVIERYGGTLMPDSKGPRVARRLTGHVFFGQPSPDSEAPEPPTSRPPSSEELEVARLRVFAGPRTDKRRPAISDRLLVVANHELRRTVRGR
jgi:hypothetical protein